MEGNSNIQFIPVVYGMAQTGVPAGDPSAGGGIKLDLHELNKVVDLVSEIKKKLDEIERTVHIVHATDDELPF